MSAEGVRTLPYFCPWCMKRSAPLEHKTLGQVCSHCLRHAGPYLVPKRAGWWRGLLPSANQQYYRDLGLRSKRHQKIGDRDGWICQLCGEPVDPDDSGPHRPSVDHIVRVRDGGTNALANLRLAHQSCNEYREGCKVVPFAKPAGRPSDGPLDGGKPRPRESNPPSSEVS